MTNLHLKDSTGREICDIEFDGRGKETFLAKATYLDDGSSVEETELDWIAQQGQCFCTFCRESA